MRLLSNILVIALRRPSVESTEALAVTTDGEPGVVSNGVPDWVYEGKFQYGELI